MPRESKSGAKTPKKPISKDARKEFERKRYTSLKRERLVFSAHANARITAKCAALVQAYMNHVVERMLEEQLATAKDKRITSTIASVSNATLPFGFPKTDVVTAFITSKKPKLLHPLAVHLVDEDHN